jgi:hypothetical protein
MMRPIPIPDTPGSDGGRARAHVTQRLWYCQYHKRLRMGGIIEPDRGLPGPAFRSLSLVTEVARGRTPLAGSGSTGLPWGSPIAPGPRALPGGFKLEVLPGLLT